MTPEQKSKLDRLHDLQGKLHEHLKYIADRMGNIPTSGILLSDDRWEVLFANLRTTEIVAQKIGAALEEAIKEAGVDIATMQQGRP